MQKKTTDVLAGATGGVYQSTAVLLLLLRRQTLNEGNMSITENPHHYYYYSLFYFINSCKRMNSTAQPQPAALPASCWKQAKACGEACQHWNQPRHPSASFVCLTSAPLVPSRSSHVVVGSGGNTTDLPFTVAAMYFLLQNTLPICFFGGWGRDFFPPQSKKRKGGEKKGPEKHV